ncbi:hypothetical protein QEZ48_14845 [Aquamicrobium lusatiense]|uniref:hypothetical protein n=1 Tax=Aquamicrobium lusatiense TaxID=89772 RepID=UPI0024558007|nr:hypothetical protein [Aquamicrobium lusatiense]MDH4992095.1 hypothetical protein [Aquamicrobium lusatiense]
MSEISIQTAFQTRQPLLPIEIERAFIDELGQSFSKIAISEKRGVKRIKGRIIPRIYAPVVSFNGVLEAETKDNKGRLQFTGRTHTNGWFWSMLLFLLILFFPLVIILIIVYWQQTKKAVAGFEKARDRVQFKLNDW